MANRYLIGSGNRDLNNPLNWSSASGGTGGDVLGSELITNAADREFSSDTGWWSKGTGTTISDGKCNFNTSVTTNALNKTFLTTGKWYKITFDCVLTTGYIQVSFGASFQNITTSGSKIVYLYASGSNIIFYTLGVTVASIDNLSIVEILTLPTSIDNAIFDANSGTGTITQSATFNCADFTCTNIGALTLANSAYAFNVFGSLTLHSNLTVSFTSTGYLYFKSTSTGKNITSNGNTQGWNRIYFDGVGGEWTNQDDWNLGATSYYFTNGEWRTNGKTISATGVFTARTGTKTLTLNNSLFIIGDWEITAPIGFTFNSGTSTVRLLTSGTLTGTAQFYNLEILGSAVITAQRSLGSDINVANLLTITGSNSTDNRLLLQSTVLGTQRTITAASILVSNVDFMDMRGTGAANWDLSAITGLSGDCHGNSNIVFTLPQIQYYKHTSGACNWNDASKWVTSSGGSTLGRIPLPQDDAVFDQNSFTGSSTITFNRRRLCRTLDMSAVNQSVGISFSNEIYCFGSYILGNTITHYQESPLAIHLYGRGSFNFNTYAKNVGIVSVNCINGNYLNLSNINIPHTANFFRVISGTFDFNDFDTNISFYYLPGGVVYLGNGTHNLFRPGSYLFWAAGAVIYSELSTIKFNPQSTSENVRFDSGGVSYNKLIFSGVNTYPFLFNGSNSFQELVIEKGKTVRMPGGASLTVVKTSIQGTPAEPVVLTSTNTTPFNLVHSGSGYHQWDYVNVSYCNATANRFYAGERSTNGGNNTGVLFRNYLLRDNMILKRFIRKINFNY